jgi:hypothetical protein
VSDPPPVSGRTFVAGPAYEITLGERFRFDAPLTIELSVDPAELARSPIQRPLAGFWDTRERLWQFVDVAFDAQRGVAAIETHHLTAWRLFYLATGSGVLESDHFSVVFEPKTYPILAGKQQDAADIAALILEALGDARARLAEAGFRTPKRRTWAFLDPNTFESSRGTLTGHIVVRNGPFGNKSELAHEVSHEFFHAVQNEYFDMYGMHVRRWWVEATAEYAATIGAGTDVHMEAAVDGTWFTKPLWTRDKKLHEYAAASFLRHLVREGASFDGLWHATTKVHSVAVTTGALVFDIQTHVLEPLEWHVKDATKRSLLEHYEQFAALSIFSAQGPSEAPAPFQWCAKKTRLDSESEPLVVRLDLDGGYTAKAVCAEVAQPGSAFSVRLKEAVPGTLARAYSLPFAERSASITSVGVLSSTTPVVLAPGPGRGVVVIGANGSSSAVELEVIIERFAAVAEEQLPSVPGLVLFDSPRPYEARSGIYIRNRPFTGEGSVGCGMLPQGARFEALGQTEHYVLLKITSDSWRERAQERCTYAFAAARYVAAL